MNALGMVDIICNEIQIFSPLCGTHFEKKVACLRTEILAELKFIMNGVPYWQIWK